MAGAMPTPPIRPSRRARALRLAILVLLGAGALPGCDDSPNTQHLPIGQRCVDDGSCGTSPYSCATQGYPGGYCDRSCATDGDCPLDAVCVTTRCRRKCVATTECRESEGYVCRSGAATAPFCDVKPGG